MARTKPISEAALAVLSECTLHAGSGDQAIVKITAGQLGRPLYEEVNNVLTAIGGKWNRKTGGHLFQETPDEIGELLEGCIQTGLSTRVKPDGFFPTPPELADRMVEAAGIRQGMYVLEPSAGSGNIARSILRSADCKLFLVELDQKLAAELHKNFDPFATVAQADFLKWDYVPFDRIIMNPPFERLADIDHVNHAYSLLAKGGRLISVMSAGVTFRREAKAVAFRQLIENCGRLERLPEGSFKSSGTMVNTVLVTLLKAA